MDVITKSKKIKFLGLCLFLLFACERKSEETTKLMIQFPSTNLSTSSAFQSISAISSSQFSSTVPTGFAGASPINCFGFYASGPEQDLRRNTCSRSGQQGDVVKFGPFLRGFAAGTNGEFELPSGQDRVIGVFGVYAESATACASMKQIGFDKSKVSKPYLLGEVGQLNLAPGDTVTIQVPLSFDSAKYFDSCQGVGFGDGSGGGSGSTIPATFSDFGSGADGDYSQTSGTFTTAAVQSTNGKYLNPGLRVASIPDATHWNATTPLSSNFSINDEVLITVVAAKGSNPDLVCGGNLQRGSYRFAKIKSKTTMQMEFYDAPYDFSISQPNTTAIANPNYNSGDFCDIRIVRVAHLNDVTISGPSSLQAITMDTSASNGIIAMRVKGTLTLAAPNALWAQGRGFQPALGTDQGFGSLGKFVGGSAGTMGGYVAGFYLGGSGGSNYGFGGGGLAGNAGAGVLRAPTVANHLCDNLPCTPVHKMFMGGSGGADGMGTPAIGGAGGGIIFIVAYNTVIGTGYAAVDASGLPTYTGSNGTGGGAGGTIVFRTNILNSTAGALRLYASGGKPQDITGGSYSPGGGGGGGYALLHYCTLNAGINVPIFNIAGGAAATNTTTTYMGASGGAGLAEEAAKSDLCHLP